MQAALTQIFGETCQPRHRLDDALGDKRAGAVTLGQHAFLDQARDRLAHGDPRQLQCLRQVALAGQRVAGLDIAARGEILVLLNRLRADFGLSFLVISHDLEMVRMVADRVLVLEDTIELQCAARDHVPLRTRAGVVTMNELVRSAMRMRPDRVVVGEVRGGEALDLIKVWGTGHPGGIATIHASSALGALLRVEQLILEVAVNPPRALIAEAVNVVVFIAGRGRKRCVETIARVTGFDGVGYRLADVLETPFPELPLPAIPSLPSTTPGELP